MPLFGVFRHDRCLLPAGSFRARGQVIVAVEDKGRAESRYEEQMTGCAENAVVRNDQPFPTVPQRQRNDCDRQSRSQQNPSVDDRLFVNAVGLYGYGYGDHQVAQPQEVAKFPFC